MVASIFLLFTSGLLNFILGRVWNFERQRVTGVNSNKYLTLWIIGIVEIVVTIILLISLFLDSNS